MAAHATRKLNCWQFKNCGREKGGLLAGALGECPVASALKYDGLNDGVGGGRACWMVEDSCCRMIALARGQGNPCRHCEFYQRVLYEQDQAVQFRMATCPPKIAL